MVKKETKRKRGAPKKSDAQKKTPDGLTFEQEQWIKAEAKGRGVSEAFVLREAVDWYRTAKETKRADVSGSEMFDDKLAGVSE